MSGRADDMDLATLWSRLDEKTRDWMIAHNGEALTPAIVDALTSANHGSAPHSITRDDDGDPVLIDEAIDWVESTANDE